VANSSTAALLTLLKSRGAVANFFVAGAAVSAGNSSLLAQAVADGHSLHSLMYAFPLMSDVTDSSAVEADVLANERAFKTLSCQDPVVVRPPLGLVANVHLQTLLVRAV
jgi:peptidoglycan/xylan/chitin deacetylase (PgdA/CDA1 family)